MTSIADLEHSDLKLLARHRTMRFRAWLLKRGRRVLPEYEAERATWWAVLRRLLLLSALCFVAFFYGLLVSILPPFMLLPAAAPPVILALMVVWALPEAPNPPMRILTGVFLTFSALLYIWPNYLAISFGGLPWISVRRLIGVVAVLLLLTCISSSRRFRSELGDVLRSATILTRLLIGFVAVQLISVLFSGSIGGAINRMVDIQITWTAMFFIAAWYGSRSDRRVEVWVNIMIAVSIFMMTLAVFEFHAKHVLWADHIPSFLQVQDESVKGILAGNFRERYRIVATLTSPLSYGEFLAMVCPFYVYKMLNAKNTSWFLFWGGMDCLVLASCFLSGARLAMVGFIVAHAIYLFLWAARHWRNNPGGFIAPVITILYPALLAVATLAIETIPALHNRILGGGATASSNDARRQQFEMAVPAIAKRPLFGYGPGNGGGAIGWYTPGGDLSVDSGYLTIATDYGLLGFLCFYGMVVLAGVETGRSSIYSKGQGAPLAAALCATFAAVMSTKSVLSQPDNYPLLYIFLGMAIAVLYNNKRKAMSPSG